MKLTLQLLLITCTVLIFSCESDDNSVPIPAIDQLPLATQTGENTFGCLINGEAVVDEDVRNTFIQLVDGTYNFKVNGGNENNELGAAIYIDAWPNEIKTGVYSINEGENGSCSAGIDFDNILGGIYSNDNSGQLTITKVDDENSIVSGTFFFDVFHPDTGEKIEIREGRFDAIYLR